MKLACFRHALGWSCSALPPLHKCALASRTHASFFPSGNVVVARVLSSLEMSSGTHVTAIGLKLR